MSLSQSSRRSSRSSSSRPRFSSNRARRRRGDLGMATAEYAVGTCAAAGLGGVLYKLLTSDTVMHLLTTLITKAFSFLL